MDQATLQQLITATQYPAMTAVESTIARQWIMAHGAEYDSIEFNCRVGNSVELGPEFDDTTRRQAMLLSQKRIDVLARLGSEVTIVEVKVRASLGTLGQLLGYQLLYRQDHPEATAVHLVAIAYDALVDVEAVLQAYGVDVELFPNLEVIPQPDL